MNNAFILCDLIEKLKIIQQTEKEALNSVGWVFTVLQIIQITSNIIYMRMDVHIVHIITL